MRRVHHRIGWLSLVVCLSLLLQLIPQAAPAEAAAPLQQQGTEQSLAGAASQLEQALIAINESADAAALSEGLADAAAAWATIQRADRGLRASLRAQAADLDSRGHRQAGARQAAQLAEHISHFERLSAGYRALLQASGRGRQETQQASADLLAALAASDGRPQLPELRTLPNRPAPEGPAVRREPALNLPSSAGPAQRSQAETSASAESITATAVGQPTPADRASTEDASITPEIRALAADLGYDPVAIFAFVRNSIAFEPYYGSRKGGLLTYWERSGNDIDTASLLIALLRASGYPARYIQGTVAVEEARALNWLGNAADLGVAGSILATGGVPVGITANGFLIKEHVWVEVYDPARTDVDFNDNGRVDIGDIQTVASQLGTAELAYDFDRDGTVDQDDVAYVRARWRQAAPAAPWVALDASFKQYDFAEPLDIAALTGFDAESYVTEVAANSETDDALQAIYGLPRLPEAGDPYADDDADLDFAEVKAAEATEAITAYIAANPQLSNVDLLGGSYIISETISALPGALPLQLVPGEPTGEFAEVPAGLRDYVRVELYDEFGFLDLSYQASFPSLANQRVTVSYVAATPSDQAVIDSYGGTLLTTPPVVDLVPVLRVGGVEVARGSPAPMGEQQTRSLTFTDANGRSSTVQNSIDVGETYAVGLAYGRTSADAIAASQARLAAARAALPTNAEGDPDVNAPGNMAEPVIGEMLHLSLQAYFNQLDTYSEVVARGRDIRWWRYLSAGVGVQDLVFGYCFGSPCETRGGGQTFDIQQNVVAGLSLSGNSDDERIFLQTSGYFGSALEHSLFGNLGKGAVSSIRLLSLALQQEIPVYRIDSSNKAAVFPLLQLDPGTESFISSQIDQGQVVTVSRDEIVVNDWTGVGYIVMDPVSGAAAYLISGGLFGERSTVNGGALWDILTNIAAFAWLAINLGLDLWGIWAGIGLLLVPEPTLLTKIAGIGLIAANLIALGFDVADLWDLASGNVSAQQYIGEQITGLIIEALLKRVGIAAAAEIVRRLGPETVSQVARQLSDVTGGVSDRLLGRGFSEQELVDFSSRLTTQSAWDAVDNVGQRYGDDVARSLVNNDYIAGKNATERIADLLNDVPNAPGLDQTISNAVSRGDFGYAYELQRAAAAEAAGRTVTGYGERIPVQFQRVTGFDASGNPILDVDAGGAPRFDTQPLEGDVVLDGRDFIDAKHGAQGNQDLHIWNQIQKAQAAIDAGLIDSYRFECSASMGARMRQWAATNAPDVQFVTNLGDGFP